MYDKNITIVRNACSAYLKAPLKTAARNMPARPGTPRNTFMTKYIINYK
jgi:hypothetical protein